MLREPGQARLEKGFLHSRNLVVCRSVERLSEYIHGYGLAAYRGCLRFLKQPWHVATMTGLSFCHGRSAINGLGLHVMESLEPGPLIGPGADDL